ncbi:hypothetical protein ABT391_29820, partial [Streptomyces jumonjinensis]|uniref:hypothetical protein n=1 Tax=Streptomyces jumonjinensis TaxID=1945 RepID=UPI003329AD17
MAKLAAGPHPRQRCAETAGGRAADIAVRPLSSAEPEVWSGFAVVDFFGELGEDGEEVADDAVVGEVE